MWWVNFSSAISSRNQTDRLVNSKSAVTLNDEGGSIPDRRSWVRSPSASTPELRSRNSPRSR